MNNRGFTLIELLLSTALMIVLISTVSVVFIRLQANNERDVVISEVVSVMRTSQSRAIFGIDSTDHGIKFNLDEYIEFIGDTYDPDDSTNKTHKLPPGIKIKNISLDLNDELIFERNTGVPFQNGSVQIEVNGTNEKQITINDVGTIDILNLI